jgi:tetratricopeptide (TPR) repeat protein/tRNA A-37 threonylcarbamoyl transferase component Bud32
VQETKPCPYCREEIKSDAIKCKHCGSMLTEVPAVTTDDPTTAVKLALAARYEIIEEIGRGGMAVVYKARQKTLERIVALKVLPHQFTHDREFLDRFHREARVASQLRHPHIVTIFDEGIEQGVHYIAMEYLTGTDLHTFIKRRGKLDSDEAVRIVAPIAEALDYAHKMGVVHRDVKSSNIIGTKTSGLVLMDFGIAHAVAGRKLTRTGTVIGTPEYMSPEQADGREVDARSDIYGLGVVLYECLTGELPFRGDNPLTVINKVIHEEPRRPSEVVGGLNADVDRVIARSMAKEPRERYQSCGEMMSALEGTNSGAGRRRTEPPVPKVTRAESTRKLEPQRPARKEGEQRKKVNRVQRLINLIGVLVLYLVILLTQRRGEEGSVLQKAQQARPQAVGPTVGQLRVQQQEQERKLAEERQKREALENEKRQVSEANALFHEKQYPKALVAYKKVVERNPSDAFATFRIAYIYAEGKNYDEAIRFYKKAIQLNPNDALAYYNMGNAYSAKGDKDKAIEFYEKAIQLNPNDADVYNNMGTAYSAKGDKDKAIEFYEKAIQLNPSYASAYYNMGTAYLAKGDMEKTTECYQKAARLGNKDAQSWLRSMNISW